MIKIRESFDQYMKLKTVHTPNYQVKHNMSGEDNAEDMYSIYKNPTKDEIGKIIAESEKIKDYGIELSQLEKYIIRAFIFKGDLYAWHSVFSIHAFVIDPITLYHAIETLPLQFDINERNEVELVNLGKEINVTKYQYSTKAIIKEDLEANENFKRIAAPNVKYKLLVVA